METMPKYLINDDQHIIDLITSHLSLYWDKTQNIPIESLNFSGVATQDSMEKYLQSGDSYYSSSDFKEIIKSPFHLFFHRESGWKNELNMFLKKKGHYDLGTLLHECVLEPAKFKKVVPVPSFNTTSNEGVSSKIEWFKETIKKESEEDYNAIFAKVQKTLAEGSVDTSKIAGKRAEAALWEMNSGLYTVQEDHATIAKITSKWLNEYSGGIIPRLLRHAKREVSIYDTQNFSLPLKIRPDAIVFEENVGVNAVISVKTTASPYPRKFFNDYAKYEYPVSDAMYEEVASKVTGRKFNCTLVIMIQTVAPFGVALFQIKREDMNISKAKFYTALSTATECLQTGKYPGYESLAERGNMGISHVELPSWYQNDLLPLDIEE